MRRTVAIAFITVGLVLGAGAAVLRWVVLPYQQHLPTDTNTLRVYQGVAPTLLNPAAVAAGHLAQAKLSNVPITVRHRTTVLKSNSSDALVRDNFIVSTPAGPLAQRTYYYVVDRHNLGPAANFTSTPVTAQRGLTFNFPIGVGKHDYLGWVSQTRTTTTLRYLRAETHAGLHSYVFTATVGPAQIVDPQELSGLPTAVPKTQLGTLATALGIPASTEAAFRPLIARLPAVIPLVYTFQAQSTYWVDPRTGRVTDLNTTETRSVALPASILGSVTPIAPISVIHVAYAPSSVAAAVRESKSDGRALTAIGTTIPIALVVLGAILLLVGGFGMRRPRRRTIVLPPDDPPATAQAPPGEPAEVTPAPPAETVAEESTPVASTPTPGAPPPADADIPQPRTAPRERVAMDRLRRGNPPQG